MTYFSIFSYTSLRGRQTLAPLSYPWFISPPHALD